ncbi:DMT family transporter [Streptomyces sp. NBC_00083]|uniref:DMT family transporter n=1 Tax=Streptomyces sp. NBC_00083 TaxID=2975647 RepID=UPI002250EFF2|nr:DMT family transporter [Streptomyces sp. NBC_00083]MCX5386885.1 DMT family transporter [Streptomyces sp. NBC_00083]
MSALVLAVLLSLVSAVAYAAAAIVQERVAASAPSSAYAPVRRPAWWGSVALNGLGATLHVAALAFGPLTLVQPLGALTIVFALPMSAVFVRHSAGAAAWRGAVMATVGLAGLLVLTRGVDTDVLAPESRLVLVAAGFGGVAALFLASRALRRSATRSVLLATAAGAAFGLASVFTKSVAEDWDAGLPLHEVPILCATAGFACAGLLLSQASYRGAGLAAPLATVTVVNPVVAAAIGLTLFGESFRYGVAGTAIALGSGAVAAGGLVLLTTERLAATRHDEPATTEGPPARPSGDECRAKTPDPREGTPDHREDTPDQTATPPALR